jgi:Arc/MetJ-type ribon-helix-helix transcriptional regulator
MKVTLPDSLKGFVEQQVTAGHFANPDAFVSDLVRAEAEMFGRIAQGEPLPVDELFGRRLEALLDEAEQSGAYTEVTTEDFDALVREGSDLARKRQSP